MYNLDDIISGFEIEFLRPHKSKDWDLAAFELTKILGTTLPVTLQATRQKTNWVLKSDLTVRAQPYEERYYASQSQCLHDFELASPPKPGEEGLANLEKMFETLINLGDVISNGTCGFHIHASPNRKGTAFKESELRNFASASLEPEQEGRYYQLIDSERMTNVNCARYISSLNYVSPDNIDTSPINDIIGSSKHCKISLSRLNRLTCKDGEKTIEFKGKEGFGFTRSQIPEHIAYARTMLTYSSLAILDRTTTFRSAARLALSDEHGMIEPQFRGTRAGLLAVSR